MRPPTRPSPQLELRVGVALSEGAPTQQPASGHHRRLTAVTAVLLILALTVTTALLILKPWQPTQDQARQREIADATAAVQQYNDAFNRFTNTDNVQELAGYASPELMAGHNDDLQRFRDIQVTVQGDQTMRIDSASWQPGVVTFRTCTNFMDVRFYDATGTEIGIEDARPTLPGKLVMEHQGERWIATSETRVDEPC